MYSTLPQMLYEKAQKIPGADAQLSKDESGEFRPVSYKDFVETVLDMSAGLTSLGAQRGEHIGLIADNRAEWQICSMGIMAAGCADIPRGCETTTKELAYILDFSECRTVIVENVYTLKKITECAAELPSVQNIILINSGGRSDGTENANFKIYTYEEILNMGKEFRAASPGRAEEILRQGTEEDTATIIFTSGTTGVPKGVELVHRNFLCQLEDLAAVLPGKQGDRALCVLPVWHSYEREIEYYILYIGGALCYSKPVTSVLMADMKKVRPQIMASVPRIWDAIYKFLQKQINATSPASWAFFKTVTAATTTIRHLYDIIHGRNQRFKRPNYWFTVINKVFYIPIAALLPWKWVGDIVFYNKIRGIIGRSFKIGVSGGGGLAPKLDRFFNSIGIRIVEGYGLTETAPVCCMRYYRKPVLGTIGRVLPYCQGKVLDRDGNECAPGQKGILYIKGANVMKGYYRQPELTRQVLSEDGWLDTGDIVIRTFKGEIIVKGRQKDTIVLRSGENVEPFPIECKLAESPYITQAVVVGQDKNCLGALILPDKDAIEEFARQQGMDTGNMAAVLKSETVHTLIFKEMERLITPKNGFKPFEKIGRFIFLNKPFEVGVELSAKQDIIRYKINEIYKLQIMMMFWQS